MTARKMRSWDGPLSPGEHDRQIRAIARKVLHPPCLRPQHLKHRSADRD